jgi:hypothetical protein
MMRVGLFKPLHVKTLVAQEQRMLLTSRKLLQRKLLDVESDLRGTLRNFGLKVVGGSRYEGRVRELVEGFPGLAAIVEPLLSVRRGMRQQFAVLHKMLLDTVRGDLVCRQLMTAPGVGAVNSSLMPNGACRSVPPAGEIGSQRTRRWREPDSNHRSRRERNGHGRAPQVNPRDLGPDLRWFH